MPTPASTAGAPLVASGVTCCGVPVESVVTAAPLTAVASAATTGDEANEPLLPDAAAGEAGGRNEYDSWTIGTCRRAALFAGADVGLYGLTEASFGGA